MLGALFHRSKENQQALLKVVVVCCLVAITDAFGKEMAVYTDPKPDALMKIAHLDSLSGKLYVGGRNKIYQFDKYLNIIDKVYTGPVPDNNHCQPKNCTKKLYARDNYVKGMEITYGSNNPSNRDSLHLISCSSVYQGMCQIRSAENIEVMSDWIGAFNDTSTYVAGADSSVIFIGRMDNGHGIYAATTYDNRDPKYFPASVSARKLYKPELRRFSEMRGVKFHSKYLQSYRVEYIYGFEHRKFSYFVTVQNSSVDNDLIETRLARVCQQDSNFSSYMEVPLRCYKSGIYYNLASAAFLKTVDKVMAERLESTKYKDSVLYISFSATIPHMGLEIDRKVGSVICSFPMSIVESTFLNETLDCFSGKPNTHLLEHIVGAKVDCKKHEVENYDGCGSAYNNYIEGRTPIRGSVLYSVRSQITMLATSWQSSRSVAIIGTEHGHVMKVDLSLSRHLYDVEVGDSNGTHLSKIERSSALGPLSFDIYVLSGRKVIKIPIKSCTMYKYCDTCFNSEDPLNCGWCGSHCSHLRECDAKSEFQRIACPPFIVIVSPANGTVMGGTEITIIGENFGDQGGNHEIYVTVADQPCIVSLWMRDTIKCRTKPVNIVTSGPVVVNVRGFDEHTNGNFNFTASSHLLNFSYVEPKLYGISPTYGPKAGGTTVTVYGENLDIGTKQLVLLSCVPCKITRKSPNKLWCETNSYVPSCSGDKIQNSSVVMIFDGIMTIRVENLTSNESVEGDLVIGKEFEYRSNPDVRKIYPNISTVSGLMNITVEGMNLNNIPRIPKIIITVNATDGRSISFQGDCKVTDDSGIEMTCLAPSVNASEVEGLASGKPVVSDVTFFIDGNIALTELKDKKFKLTYFPDPVYFPVDAADVEIKDESPKLEVKGKYLDYVHNASDVQVLVGGKICPVAEFGNDSLTCMLPQEILESSEQHAVQVIAGPQRFDLGSVNFYKEDQSYLAATFVLAVGLLFVCVALVYLWRSYKKKKALKRSYASALTEERENPNPRNEYTRERASPEEVVPMTEVDSRLKALLERENLLIERKYLRLHELIGKGYFASVHVGQLLLPGKKPVDVAIKISQNKPCGPSVEEFIQEGLLMKDFNHPNVLSLIGICIESDGSPMVLTPLMKNGDLSSYIRDEQKEFVVKDLIKFGIDIAAGMAYLSKFKYIHRDLATRNCMLDANLTVKVADFGLSRDVYEQEYYTSDNKKALPVRWMAVESLEKAVYSEKTDVWSYGVTLWELMTRGTIPYADVSNWDMLAYLRSGRRLPKPVTCPNALYSIMLRCWLEDPHARPTFKELVKEVAQIIENEQGNKKIGLKVLYVNQDPESAGF